MASPQQLNRRVDRHEDDLRAIADTVVDIHETQEQHSEELAAFRETQQRHTEMLTQHSEMLSEVLTLLRDGAIARRASVSPADTLGTPKRALSWPETA